MQTFDVSTNILDSQLSFFQRGKNLRTQPGLEETVPSVLPVQHTLSLGEPAVRALPICGLRIKRHDLLKLVLTQVVVLVLLILIVALKSKVWYKMVASVGLCMIPLLVTKAEASSLLPLLLLVHDVCLLLVML